MPHDVLGHPEMTLVVEESHLEATCLRLEQGEMARF
jgi:hypothetical protein